MNIALIASNVFPIDPSTTKGTEIFLSIFLNNLVKFGDTETHHYTVFAAGDSQVPVPVESILPQATSNNPHIARYGKNIMFELALLSKAFSQQDRFDLAQSGHPWV